VRGQGVIGQACAWCGLPAVCELEVQPAQYRTVSRVDPVSGQRVCEERVSRFAVVVPACDAHKGVTVGQPPPVGRLRQRTARDVDQLGLFVSPDEMRLRSAIRGETGR
jgi:hypothetical protein